MRYISDTAFELDGEHVDLIALRARVTTAYNGRNVHALNNAFGLLSNWYNLFRSKYTTDDERPLFAQRVRENYQRLLALLVGP